MNEFRLRNSKKPLFKYRHIFNKDPNIYSNPNYINSGINVLLPKSKRYINKSQNYENGFEAKLKKHYIDYDNREILFPSVNPISMFHINSLFKNSTHFSEDNTFNKRIQNVDINVNILFPNFNRYYKPSRSVNCSKSKNLINEDFNLNNSKSKLLGKIQNKQINSSRKKGIVIKPASSLSEYA